LDLDEDDRKDAAFALEHDDRVTRHALRIERALGQNGDPFIGRNGIAEHRSQELHRKRGPLSEQRSEILMERTLRHGARPFARSVPSWTGMISRRFQTDLAGGERSPPAAATRRVRFSQRSH
jgi:hypothetical protein